MAQAQVNQIKNADRVRISFQYIFDKLSPLLVEVNGNSAKFTSPTELRHTIIGLAYYVSNTSPQYCHHLFGPVQNKGKARKNENASSGETNWHKVLELGGFKSFSTNRPSSLGRLCNIDEKTNTCFTHCKLIAFFIHLLYKARGVNFENNVVNELSRRYMIENMSSEVNIPADVINASHFVIVIDFESFKLRQPDFPFSAESRFGELPWVGLHEESEDTPPAQMDEVDRLVKRFNVCVQKRKIGIVTRDKLKNKLISLEDEAKKCTIQVHDKQVEINNYSVEIARFVQMVKSGMANLGESFNLMDLDEDSAALLTGNTRRGTKRGADDSGEEYRIETDETIAVNLSPLNNRSVRSESQSSPSSDSINSLSDTTESYPIRRKTRPVRNIIAHTN